MVHRTPAAVVAFIAVALLILALLLLLFTCAQTGTEVGASLSPGVEATSRGGKHRAMQAPPTPNASDTSEGSVRRHASHPLQDVVRIQRLHAELGIPFHGPLTDARKSAIQTAIIRAYEDCVTGAGSEKLQALGRFETKEDRKSYWKAVHGIALLAGEVAALGSDAYIRYSGKDFGSFYRKCLSEYPDYYFACVGADEMHRVIVLVVPAPPGSQIAIAADAALAHM